jgi:hypothetical protein
VIRQNSVHEFGGTNNGIYGASLYAKRATDAILLINDGNLQGKVLPTGFVKGQGVGC